MLDLAIQTPPEHIRFSELLDTWQAADELGFKAAFTFDHLIPLNPPMEAEGQPPSRGPQLEGWVTLAGLATHTQRLEVGTLVSGVTYRHPSLLAKMAVTLDHLTGGRAILGLGAAWHELEHHMYGIDFPPVGERMARLEEALEMFRMLFSQDLVDFQGAYYRLKAAEFEPKPSRSEGIPILVGGGGERTRRIAARFASIYNGFFPPWEWPAVNDALDEALRVHGRDPRELRRSAFVFAELSGEKDREARLLSHFTRTRGGTVEEARKRVLIGTPANMIQMLRAYRDAGVSLVVLNLRPPLHPKHLERFADQVMGGIDDA